MATLRYIFLTSGRFIGTSLPSGGPLPGQTAFDLTDAEALSTTKSFRGKTFSLDKHPHMFSLSEVGRQYPTKSVVPTIKSHVTWTHETFTGNGQKKDFELATTPRDNFVMVFRNEGIQKKMTTPTLTHEFSILGRTVSFFKVLEATEETQVYYMI